MASTPPGKQKTKFDSYAKKLREITIIHSIAKSISHNFMKLSAIYIPRL